MSGEKEFRGRVVRQLADMVALHLFGDGGPIAGILLQELAERTGYREAIVQNRLIDVPWWEDVPAMVQAAGLQLGVSLRSPNGKEVTFYPEYNFDKRDEAPLEASALVRTHNQKGHSQR
jgi:hypothetical protein